MLKFHADSFVRACKYLVRLDNRVIHSDQWRTEVERDLLMLKRELERIGFRLLAEQAQHIIDRTKMPVSVVHCDPELERANNHTVSVLLAELSKAIEHKLKTCLFLRVDTDRKRFYEQDDLPLFGREVDKAFPKASYHISEAGRCFALERWSACVHHLMLAIEEALRKWAKTLKVKVGRPLVLSDWEKILQQARNLLTQLKNEPKSLTTDRRVKRLAETSGHFELIKEAWRNHSSHGREIYDERRAKNILNHVEVFLQSLAMKKPVS